MTGQAGHGLLRMSAVKMHVTSAAIPNRTRQAIMSVMQTEVCVMDIFHAAMRLEKVALGLIAIIQNTERTRTMSKTEYLTAAEAEQKMLEHLAGVEKFAKSEVLGAVCVDDIVYAVIRNPYSDKVFYDVVVWHTRARELPSENRTRYLGYRAKQPDFLDDGDILYRVAQGIYVEPVCGVVVELQQENTPVLTVHKQTVTTITLNDDDHVLHEFTYEED